MRGGLFRWGRVGQSAHIRRRARPTKCGSRRKDAVLPSARMHLFCDIRRDATIMPDQMRAGLDAPCGVVS